MLSLRPMRRWINCVVLVVVLALALVLPSIGDSKRPVFDIKKPTIVAFFPPVSEADLRDGDTNEALTDFQFYAAQVREPLRKAGVDFEETYATSFEVRLGNKTTLFRPGEVTVGYYFIAPGKKPHIEYGVMTDLDLLDVAHKYLGIPQN